MSYRVVSRYLGAILMLNALMMALSAGVSVVYGFDSAFYPLIISALITCVAGLYPVLFFLRPSQVSTREGYVIFFFAWILSCLFGMLPYLFWGGEFTLINAWYESVSGFSTTGGTILSNIEMLPHGLLFWRSATHWIGGMGVVLLILMVLPEVGAARMRLSKMEISSLSKENYQFRTQHILRIITTIYFGITLAATIAFFVAGMNLFDAVNHAFSTVATGGFSTKDLSILSYNSVAIEVVAMFFMMVAGMHFGLIYMTITGKPNHLFSSPVVRYYVVSLLLFGVFIAVNLFFENIEVSFWSALRKGLFQSISLGTTTGFATADSSLWPSFSIILLLFLSLQCGCSGSTSGGIKVDRICIFKASLKTQMQKQLHPNAYIPVKLGKVTLEPETVASVNLFIVLYLLILFIVGFILSLFGHNLLDGLTSSIAHIGNVGPGFGSVGSLSNYAHFSTASKIVLTIEMLLGRLEIYGFLLIFFVYRWR
ncbi:MAG: TrkH family potassium uptake protein [Prevotellaceae bacterium]|jgi:trk system potassium uptake protein TrkH|nr:TrkH family potassium uptake protein [Prevotellaceae bacterium]